MLLKKVNISYYLSSTYIQSDFCSTYSYFFKKDSSFFLLLRYWKLVQIISRKKHVSFLTLDEAVWFCRYVVSSNLQGITVQYTEWVEKCKKITLDLSLFTTHSTHNYAGIVRQIITFSLEIEIITPIMHIVVVAKKPFWLRCYFYIPLFL